jgi:hypothetical protein
VTEIVPPADVLAFLKRAHDDFQPLAEKLEFDKAFALHRTIIALYGSILEMTGCSIVLIDKQLITGVPVLLRAVLEGYVDLVNLIRNARYGYCLELSYIKEWLKILDEAKAGKNEYLQEITQAPSLDAMISSWREEKRKLEAKDYKAPSVETKFKWADMEKEYRSIYNSLCCDAHNNLRALIERHIEREPGDFSVVYYKAYTPEDSAIYVGMNAELLVRATEALHEFLKSPVKDRVRGYREELDKLREEGEAT